MSFWSWVQLEREGRGRVLVGSGRRPARRAPRRWWRSSYALLIMTLAYVTSQRVRVSPGHVKAERDPAARPPRLLPPARRGPADRPDPRDHRPLATSGSRRSSTSRATHTVLAPDLLGHGESAKPRGDYSLGAYASAVRDTMVALGHDRATIVGHSLGGGIAMQFAYQFPERCERLVLVSSGGLGREVHPLLRASTLPGSECVLPLLTHARVLGAGEAVGRVLGLLRLQAGHRPRRGRPRLRLARRRRGARGVHRDDARGARPRRPAGQRARPPLPRRVAALADRLGRGRPDHPGRPRPRRPRGDARQPARAARRRRPLPAARAPARVRRAARGVRRRDRARPSSTPTTMRERLLGAGELTVTATA